VVTAGIPAADARGTRGSARPELAFGGCRDAGCDRHAHCPFCGELMADNATGVLVCATCRTDAAGPPVVRPGRHATTERPVP
jgi:hypothetical protein